MASLLSSISLSSQPFSLTFINSPTTFAAGLITGSIEIHTLHDSDGLTLKTRITPFTSSCRSIVPHPHIESTLIAASSEGQIALINYENFEAPQVQIFTATTPTKKSNEPIGINRISIPESHKQYLFTGDDSGVIRIYSISTSGINNTPVCVTSNHTDYISTFIHSSSKNTTIALSGDGSISVYELNKVESKAGPFVKKSDEQDDEFLSGCILKSGKKLLCGSQGGNLNVWGWGTWGDLETRFPGHPDSIDAVLKLDENTVLTGSSDGLIRVVQVQPDKFLGVLGNHEGWSVEGMVFSPDQKVIVSWSHDDTVRVWDATVLQDDDDDEEGEEIDTMALANQAGEGVEMEDDDDEDMEDDEEQWEDMEDSDDDDSDDGGGKPFAKLKTDSEKFFEDL